ncbi:MAG: TetR/AcrR family transcriptional regulator [Pseudomonadota bacterium]
MRLTAENKAKIRQRVIEGAARRFRGEGYYAVNIDGVMEEAGLTRGAFYAHFKSKAELFAQVAEHEHPIRRMLERRDGPDAATLWQQMLEIFDGYLDPANLETIFTGCTLASLTGDATREGEAVRSGFQTGWTAVAEEMRRGQPHLADEHAFSIDAALVLASGAVATATACADHPTRERVLSAARQAFHHLLESAAPSAPTEEPKS